MGAIDVASAVLSHPPERLVGLERFLPTTVLETSRTFTLIAGSLLLVTAWGLRRGKRRAFVFALFLCAVSVPVNVLKALDVEEATVAALLLFALGVSGEAFRVKSRELSWRGWGVLALVVGGALVAAATLGAYWVEARYGGAAAAAGGAGTRSRARSARSTGSSGSATASRCPRPRTSARAARTARWIGEALPVLGLGYASGVAVLALGPATFRTRHGAEHRLIGEHRARVRHERRVAVRLRPRARRVREPERARRHRLSLRGRRAARARRPARARPRRWRRSWPRSRRYCQERDWELAFFQAAPEALALYAARGWRAIHLGEEPVIDPERSRSRAAPWATCAAPCIGSSARACACSRSARPCARSTRRSTTRRSARCPGCARSRNAWLDAHPGGEKTFGMGRFDARQLATRWVLVALSAAGRRRGVRDVGRGAGRERLVARPHAPARRRAARRHGPPRRARRAREAKERGDGGLSLGLSALVSGRPAPDPDADRVRAFLRRRLEPFYDFEGLFHWKKKFQPRFEDRFLVVPGRSRWPRVLFALARAQTPGGLARLARNVRSR